MVSQVENFRGRNKKTYYNLYAQLVDISLIYIYYDMYIIYITSITCSSLRLQAMLAGHAMAAALGMDGPGG